MEEGISVLYVALVAVYGGVSSAAAVETKYPHGGFEPHLDKHFRLVNIATSNYS